MSTIPPHGPLDDKPTLELLRKIEDQLRQLVDAVKGLKHEEAIVDLGGQILSVLADLSSRIEGEPAQLEGDRSDIVVDHLSQIGDSLSQLVAFSDSGDRMDLAIDHPEPPSEPPAMGEESLERLAEAVEQLTTLVATVVEQREEEPEIPAAPMVEPAPVEAEPSMPPPDAPFPVDEAMAVPLTDFVEESSPAPAPEAFPPEAPPLGPEPQLPPEADAAAFEFPEFAEPPPAAAEAPPPEVRHEPAREPEAVPEFPDDSAVPLEPQPFVEEVPPEPTSLLLDLQRLLLEREEREKQEPSPGYSRRDARGGVDAPYAKDPERIIDDVEEISADFGSEMYRKEQQASRLERATEEARENLRASQERMIATIEGLGSDLYDISRRLDALEANWSRERTQY